MRNFDFSSWQGVLSTLLGLAVITLLGVGIRVLVMQTVQQRRERENRQINERLRTPRAPSKNWSPDGQCTPMSWWSRCAISSARFSTWTRSRPTSRFQDRGPPVLEARVTANAMAVAAMQRLALAPEWDLGSEWDCVGRRTRRTPLEDVAFSIRASSRINARGKTGIPGRG